MENSVFGKLRKFNLIMGAIHLVQAIAMVILATTVIQKIGEFQPVITQNYLEFIEGQGLVLQTKELFTFPTFTVVVL